MLVDQDSGYL